MESRDILGNVLIVAPPVTNIETLLFGPMREMMYRRTNSRVPKGVSRVFNFLWYPARASELRDYRTVLARLTCLTRVYEGKPEGLRTIDRDSVALERVRTIMRAATVIVFVYASNDPETLRDANEWALLTNELRAGDPFTRLLLGAKIKQSKSTVTEDAIGASLRLGPLQGSNHTTIEIPEPTETDMDRFQYECVSLIYAAYKLRKGEPVAKPSHCHQLCDVKAPHRHYVTNSEFWGQTERVVFMDETLSITMPKGALYPTHLRAPVLAKRKERVVPKSAAAATPVQQVAVVPPPVSPPPPPPVVVAPPGNTPRPAPLPANSVHAPGKQFTESSGLLLRKR